MTRFPLVVIPFAALVACTSVRPVEGRMERTDETFRGTVTGSGYREGTGELTLVSSRKTTCRGGFVYTTRRRGEGTLTCDDDRSGSFRIAAVNDSGSGTGDLGGQRFTFVIGNS